jgi:DNA-binding helix-hairpin-helix protein with protein kinase domain
MELQRGTKVNLTIGSQATVIKELGRGGQGIVYLVEVGGQQMALKWYLNPPDNKFYKNLEHNITAGAPSDAFIWPEYLTKKERGSYGYIMKLRPNDYFEFGNYLLARKNFKSFNAMMAAAMKICNGFMMLHRFGYSYQDLNDGNFFIRPTDGDVLICDNDNVMPQGEKSGIMGKARYMAPEIVAGGVPDKYSDRFSLSVILFMLFFANHPFEGAKVVACPCMTEKFEKEFYGSKALFVYNPDDKSNLPVRGVHQNVIKRWPLFPSLLKQTFIDQFSEEKLRNPNKRMIEQEWERVIAKVRDELVVCPHCHEETFIDTNDNNLKCINCGKDIDISKQMKLGTRTQILTAGTKLYIDNDNIPDAEVDYFPTDKNLLVIRNLSEDKWHVDTPSGKVKVVAPGDFLPILNGLKISFGSSIKGAVGAKGEIIA